MLEFKILMMKSLRQAPELACALLAHSDIVLHDTSFIVEMGSPQAAQRISDLASDIILLAPNKVNNRLIARPVMVPVAP